MILGPGEHVSDALRAATNVIQFVFVFQQPSGAVATCVVSTSVTQTQFSKLAKVARTRFSRPVSALSILGLARDVSFCFGNSLILND